MATDSSKNKSCDYNNFKRTRYFHGMLMTDRDFREEQIYHNEKRKLLNRMLHGWGVVCGLDIKLENGNSSITINPGMALDCHGNEIMVCEPYGADLTSVICKTRSGLPTKPTTPEECVKLGKAQPTTFYIGIRYEEVPTDPVPVYAPGGGCEEKVCEYSRIREGYCIKIFDQPPQQPQGKSINPSLIKRFFDECNAEARFGEVHSGTARAVDKSTIKLSSKASATDDYYKGMQIEIEHGTEVQTRTITRYAGSSQIATVGRDWDAIPKIETSYRITNERCLQEEVRAFKNDFCGKATPCPDCCPEEHYLILGTIEIDPNEKTINDLTLDRNRTYVPTTHLFRYTFSSLLNGLDTYFEIKKKDGSTETFPDVNLVHTNPLEALCWIGRIFSEQYKIHQKGRIVRSGGAREKLYAAAEVEKLRKEMEALKKTVAELRKKPQRKATEK